MHTEDQSVLRLGATCRQPRQGAGPGCTGMLRHRAGDKVWGEERSELVRYEGRSVFRIGMGMHWGQGHGIQGADKATLL